MTRSDDTKRGNEDPRERSSALTDAVLRINASLDLDTVLGEVMESAQSLTGARWGVIATVDEQGAPQDFVFSGFTSEEQHELYSWPDSARLFEHFRSLPGPLRLDDLSSYVRALGIEPAPAFARTFQGTPMRHRGTDVGSFFLADKADGKAFTDEDEEVLTLFASQAASAIVNARAHRDERRARADLEALVETSPVGVVVFDAKSGRAVSSNREARRIGEGLQTPDRPHEQLLEVMSLRRADGSEVSLSEFPIAQQLSASETVRAEEIVLSVPDGRSVRVLINATPIHGEDGTVASVVVTMQDLAPLDEIERMRTEFLSLVSHELRTPLAAIKGSIATVLDAAQTLDPAELREFLRVIDEQANHMRGLITDLLDAGRIDAGTLSVSPTPTDVGELVERARSTFLGSGRRHGIAVDLPSDLPPVMADRRRIVQVLNNLFANAARHAPESSPIRVSALREGAHVAVAVGLLDEVSERIDGNHPETLASAGHFEEARAAARDGRFASAYVNLEWLAGRMGDPGRSPCPGVPFDTPEWLMVSASWVGDGLVVDLATPDVTSWWTDTSAGVTDAVVPADALGFVSVGFDPDMDRWREILGGCEIADLLPGGYLFDQPSAQDTSGLEEGATLADAMDLALGFVDLGTGLDLEADLFDHLGGQLVLVAHGPDREGSSVEGVAALSYRPLSRNALAGTIDGIAKGISSLTGVSIQEIDSGAAGAAPATGDGKPSLGYVLHGGFVTLGTGAGALETTVAVQQGTRDDVSGTAQYRRTVEHIPHDPLLLAYVDLARVIDRIGSRGTGSDDGPLSMLSGWLGPMALGVGTDGDYSRATLVLSLLPSTS